MNITVGDILRVVMFFVQPQGAKAMMVWQLIITAASDVQATEFLDWLGALLNTTMDTTWRGVASTGIIFERFAVDKIGLDGKVTDTVGERFVNMAGTSTAEVSDQRIAALIRMKVGKPKTEGRKYVPGLSEAHAGGGLQTSTALLRWAGLGATLTVTHTVSAAGYSFTAVPGVVSVKRADFLPFNRQLSIPTATANQVRRKIGRGW